MVKEVVMMPYPPHAHGARLTFALRVGILATLCAVPLSACGMLDAWQSADTDTAPSMPAEKVMSGEYEVGPDGKLLNPNRDNLPDVPQKPTAMNKNNAEGAEAFARHYMHMIHYAWLTGETQYLEVASDPKCEGCQRFIASVREIKAKGGWSYGGEPTFEHVTRAFEVPNHPGLWHKELLQKQEANVFYDGNSIFHGDKGESHVRIQMRFEKEKGWQTAALEAEVK